MSRKPLTSLCSPSAAKTAAAARVTAPAVVGQGEGTRNRAAWLSIADFLTLENLRAVLAARAAQGAEGAPLAGEVSAPEVERASAAINFGGCVALCTAFVPDGNHGENK